MAGFGFDVEEIEVSSFDPVPEAEYTLRATEAEMKDTKAGDGKYLSVTFEISKGEYAGRKIWQNFNIHNPNSKAEKIGREQVAGWARACGKPNAKDSDELLERNFQAKVGIEKGTGGYSDKNLIKGFLTEGSKRDTTAEKSKSKFDDEPPKSEQTPKKESVKEAPKSDDKPSEKKKNPWD